MTKTDPLEFGAAYVRVSTDDQTELSPDAQIRVILDAARADGIVIPPEFIFVEKRGISGRRADNREEFQRMIAIAKSQCPAPFKRLYLWKFSRFARNQEESTFYKGILRKKCGVEIKSVSEPIMEGMFGRLIETIIEWFDEYYSFNLSGEVIRGMTEKALRNGYQSSPCLGYQAVGDGRPFVINEEEYAAAEFIHQAYHSGKDMTSIAREANQKGYHTRRGNAFDRRAIYRILTNQFYIGVVLWNNITFQGTHETRPSITSVFDENQIRLRREYRPLKRREVASCRHWLSGLLKCGICGASLSYNRSGGQHKRPDFFQCWKYSKGVHRQSCSVAVRKAEQAVLDSLLEVISTNQVTYEYLPRRSEKDLDEEAFLHDALIRADRKEQRIREAYENGIDTLEEYKANKFRLFRERENLLEQQMLLKKQEGEKPVPAKVVVLKRIRTAYDLIADPDVDYEIKGNALRRIIKKITFDRELDEFQFYYYV